MRALVPLLLLAAPAFSLATPRPAVSNSKSAYVSGIIRRVHTSRRMVALTFDACQTARPAGYDAAIVGILRRTRTPATLMLGGRWVETHAAIARELANDSLIEIGSHSYLHPHMTHIPAAEARADLVKAQDAIERVTGRRPTLFRPPYGEVDDRLVRTAASLGLQTMLWDVVSGDPDPHVSARAMTREILSHARPGSIVIMHVNGRGWHTAEALPAVIAGLRKRGFELVTVLTLLANQPHPKGIGLGNPHAHDRSDD